MRRGIAAALAAGVVLAPTAAHAQVPEPSVALLPVAHLRDGALLLRGWASCEPGTRLLEALVYANQGDVSSTTRGFHLPCDGRTHQVRVVVTPYEGAFSRGQAQATAYVLVMDDGGDTASAGASRTVRVR